MSYERKMLEELAMPTREQVERALLRALLKSQSHLQLKFCSGSHPASRSHHLLSLCNCDLFLKSFPQLTEMPIPIHLVQPLFDIEQ